MIVLLRGAGGLDVRLTRDELLIVNNALNEVCSGVHIGDHEFELRLGNSREVAQRLLARVNAALDD